MARIAGVNIPQNKLVRIGLTYIYGIGEKNSKDILARGYGIIAEEDLDLINSF